MFKLSFLTFFKKIPGGGLFGICPQEFEFCAMIDKFEERWKNVEIMLQQRFGKLPDMEAILFLIGMNELGKGPDRKKFTKEQKQDLMHIAVCTLLSQDGYYIQEGTDADGWPHFRELKPVATKGLDGQEQLLKECVIRYFEQ